MWLETSKSVITAVADVTVDVMVAEAVHTVVETTEAEAVVVREVTVHVQMHLEVIDQAVNVVSTETEMTEVLVQTMAAEAIKAETVVVREAIVHVQTLQEATEVTVQRVQETPTKKTANNHTNVVDETSSTALLLHMRSRDHHAFISRCFNSF